MDRHESSESKHGHLQLGEAQAFDGAAGPEASPLRAMQHPQGELREWSLLPGLWRAWGRSCLVGFHSFSRKDPGQIPGGICIGKNASHVIKFPIFEAVVSSALDRVWGKLGAGRCYSSRHQTHRVAEMNVPLGNYATSEVLLSVVQSITIAYL